MEKFKFTNSEGISIEISDCDPYILTNITGTGAPDSNLQLADGYQQNGSSYLSTLTDVRKLKIEIEVNGNDREDVKSKTRDLMVIFNSLLGEGKIIYSNDAGSWRIYGAVFDGPTAFAKDKYPFHQFVSIGILCADPDWMAVSDKQIKMVDYIGGLTFPITFPIKFAERGTGGRVEYMGDNPAPMLLDFRVAEGGTSVIDPRIENEKGEYIQIKKTILAGERLIINTNPKKLSVTLIDVDGIESDAWSTLYGTNNKYLQLHKGENVFQFSASSGDPELYLTFAERYCGVGK